MKHPITSALTLLTLSFDMAPASAQSQAWIRQVGTSSLENAYAVAPDGSRGVYVSGRAFGSLGGLGAGGSDAWLARYDSSGNQTWIRQFGTSSDEGAGAAAPDGAGGVYVSGTTSGSLGGPGAGGGDAWLARYDSAGNQTWIRQFGTSSDESAGAAAPDGSGGVYVSGTTMGSLGGPGAGGGDAWLARFDSAGNQTWTRQFGSNALDEAFAAAPDGSGGVYVSGSTWGALGGPIAGFARDAWLARYDDAGNQTWIRQLGSSSQDVVWAAAPDGSGGVYVSGWTTGSLGGSNSGTANTSDVWLAHYDGAGSQAWIGQFGSSSGPFGSNSDDYGCAAAPDGSGGVYVGGYTNGGLGGPFAGGANDAWLAQYAPPCGTPTSYCTSSTTTNGCTPSISGTGSASASAPSGFTISVNNVEGQKLGLIFYGLNNAGWSPLPWASGSTSYLCVKPPTQRMSSQNSGGTIGACDGSLAIDWNAFIASYPGALGAPFAANATVYAQGWFRDPAAPKTTNLSNGLQFSVCP